MRNAVAHLDDDLAFDEPVRKAKATRPRTAGPKKRAAPRSRASRGRYIHYAAIGLSATVAVGIMVNALVFQHNRHPAPLFGEAIPLGDKLTQSAAAPGPAPARPTAERTPTEPAEQTASLPPPALAIPTPAQRPRHAIAETIPATKSKPDDAIAKLLKTSGSKPSDKDIDGGKDNSKTVMAAQHALMKLGFVVKPNGTFGPATRAALATFERDQHLPVKGDMNRKVLKQLSAASGVAID